MVEPIIHWEPSRLRAIGLALLAFATSLLLTKPLEQTLNATNVQRAVASGTLCLMVFVAWQEDPIYQQISVVLSLLLAVVLPLLISLGTFREIIKVDE
jgi:xanthine/uracil permease